MWNQIHEFVFSVKLIALILILIGLYALLWWSIDNFKSIVQIIRSVLVPYFQPQEDVPLSEKFGSWAGMWTQSGQWSGLNLKDIKIFVNIFQHIFDKIFKRTLNTSREFVPKCIISRWKSIIYCINWKSKSKNLIWADKILQCVFCQIFLCSPLWIKKNRFVQEKHWKMQKKEK